MARSEEMHIDVGGREVRVTSAERVIFPATDRTPDITKLDIVNYYVAVEDGIMRALRQRPTTLERWRRGAPRGLVFSTRDWGGGAPFSKKETPRGPPNYAAPAEIQFPSGRTADEICPTEI